MPFIWKTMVSPKVSFLLRKLCEVSSIKKTKEIYTRRLLYFFFPHKRQQEFTKESHNSASEYTSSIIKNKRDILDNINDTYNNDFPDKEQHMLWKHPSYKWSTWYTSSFHH